MSENQYLIGLIAISLILAFGLFFLFRILFFRRRLSSDAIFNSIVGFSVFGIGGGLGVTVYLSDTIHSKEVTNNYYPQETKIMYDDEEVIVKYAKGKRINIKDKKRYDRVLDSCFYIEETTYFNIYGNSELVEYKIHTYQSKEKSKSEPISIEL